MKSKLFIILSSTFLVLSCRTKEDPFTDAYKKSVAWLWSQQSEDGAWHSKTHNVLEDGKVLTPYILYYLLQVPDSIYEKKQVNIDKGIAFAHQSIVASLHDTVVEWNYPNYSAAYACRVFMQTNTHRDLLEKLIEKIALEQFTFSRGVPESSMAFGGWGYGEINLKEDEFGHVDISHTRRIAETLVQYFKNEFSDDTRDIKTLPAWLDSEWQQHAIQFIRATQRSPGDARIPVVAQDTISELYDGGFVSSMYTVSTNKSQPIQITDSAYYYPSYATATCDGLLAMHALNMQETKAYKDAAIWLSDHQRIDVIDGLSPDDPEQWYQIMHYYHWSVRAEAMRAAGITGKWEITLRDALIKEQQPDGFYINPIGGVNKEDDPLMATVFCVQAFTALLQ